MPPKGEPTALFNVWALSMIGVTVPKLLSVTTLSPSEFTVKSGTRASEARVGRVRQRALCEIEWEVVVITPEAEPELVLAVTERVNGHPKSRRPVVREGVLRVLANQALLLPTEAGIEGHVLVHGPTVVHVRWNEFFRLC